MTRYIVTAVVAGLLLAAVPPAPAAEKTVKVEKEWKGGSALKADDDLWRKAPEDRMIAGPKAWEKLWKDWKFEKELPKVDFEKELILVAAGIGPNTIEVTDLVLDDKGNLKFQWSITEKGGPGYVYRILKVNREGVKTVNGKTVPKE